MKLPTGTLGKHRLWNAFLLMLIITRIATVKATPGTTIRVEPYGSMAQVGESFTINVTLSDVQNLYGVEVAVRWNASILQLVNVDVRLGNESNPDGILHEPIFIAINETVQNEGRYHLAAASTVPADSFNGTGNIVKLTFNVTGLGICRLDLDAGVTELRGKPPPEEVAPLIEHTTVDAFFGRQVSISALPATVTPNEEVILSGSIFPPEANRQVAILWRSEGEVEWRTLETVGTDEQGSYHYTWRPEEESKYEVRATAIIDDMQETSGSIYVTVEKPGQPAWVNTATIAIVVITVGVIATIVIYRKRSQSSKPRSKS